MRVENPERRRLAVLGSPIAHSKSPAIHTAAYRALGLDWEYGRAEVRAGELAGFVAGLGPEWRGLSLTVPLKREAIAGDLDTWPDWHATTSILGQANTLLLGVRGRSGEVKPRRFTTDEYGVRSALGVAGISGVRRGTVLGGGATAESAAYALGEVRLGSLEELEIAARSPDRVHPGPYAVVPLSEADLTADVVVSTIPGGVDLPVTVPRRVHGVLLDVIYDPWPTPLAEAWAAAGGRVISGLELLLHQALAQVRIFVLGDPGEELPDEPAVFEAMRRAVGGS